MNAGVVRHVAAALFAEGADLGATPLELLEATG